MAQTVAPAQAKGSPVDRFRNFLKDVQVEARKVSWPSREELRESTMVVIVTVAIVALYIFVVDRIVGQLMAMLLKA